jgi:hypothetical protein
MPSQLADPTYRDDLGAGLICRWSTVDDQPKIAHCLGTVFRPSADAPLNVRAMDENRIMMGGGYPFMGPGDFAIVEDTSQPDCPIVACTCYWRHIWSYGGIPFGVGRPEMVATLPAYRGRGLVRAIFELIHARSADRGDLVQAITGIPYFYRQFGYEYVLDLEGSRLVEVAAIPERKDDAPEPYQWRVATLDDVPHLMALYDQERSRSLVWHEVDEAYWRAHVASWDDPAVQGKDPTQIGLFGRLYMIVDAAGAVCGYVMPLTRRRTKTLWVFALQLYSHVSWPAVMPSLLRLLRAHGEQTPTILPDAKPFSEIGFNLGRAHPAYAAMGDAVAPRYDPPYAWYLRVADLPGFLRHITPVLERRLANSIMPGHTGELVIDFYRDGLRLEFAQGKLATIEPWRAPDYGNDPPAGCPALVFLQLLFGYRSLAELRAIFPDVYAEPEAALLLDMLFPKQPTTLHSLGYT